MSQKKTDVKSMDDFSIHHVAELKEILFGKDAQYWDTDLARTDRNLIMFTYLDHPVEVWLDDEGRGIMISGMNIDTHTAFPISKLHNWFCWNTNILD